MAIQIYNSLTRKKEELKPLNPPEVNIYTCGVTVYDECHIGHARSLYIFEVIRRYLAYRGFKVNFVRNITDIDDKIINRANELKADWQELVKKYIGSYYEDLAALGLGKADYEPRATENIPDMIKYIQGLIDKGFAYVTKTGVYFNVRKFTGYGKLSGQGIEQMLTGVRKESDETKEDPLDFALWKSSKEGEPYWPSPWGNGRPGWHIECSVMSQKYLKADTLDIHAGGRDLIFPHHENELAQAEALTGKPFAQYWIHHGLLTINGQKMSKSLGNFVTIKDALKNINAQENAKADILKNFFLQAHYAMPMDFSEKSIKESTEAMYSVLELLENDFDIEVPAGDDEEINSQISQFEKAMDDDFNTPQARAAIFGIIKRCNYLLGGNPSQQEKNAIQYGRDSIRKLGAILGLSLPKLNPHDPLWRQRGEANVMKDVIKEDTEVQNKINERILFKKQRKFAEADKIRKELEEKGIVLKDNKDGTTEWEWKR